MRRYIFLESRMLHQIEKWIDQTNIKYQEEKISCSKFVDEYKGCYPLGFLQQSYVVVVDTIPKPNFPGLRQKGLGDFIDREEHGITYKKTYYVVPQLAADLR